MSLVITLLANLLTALNLVIVGQVILSWLIAFNVVSRHGRFISSVLQAFDIITEPLYRPIRRLLPDFGGLDFAPMVVLLIVFVLQNLLSSL